MKFTDKEALQELNRARSPELWDYIEEYPEEERDNKTDLQVLYEECDYIVSCFEEDGHIFCEDLEASKEILKETKNGKVTPYYINTLQPKYRPHQIEQARNTINEYRRLKALLKRLKSKL